MEKPRLTSSLPSELFDEDSVLGKQVEYAIRCREDGVDGWKTLAKDLHGTIRSYCPVFQPDFRADSLGLRCISGYGGQPPLRQEQCVDCMFSLVKFDASMRLVHMAPPPVLCADASTEDALVKIIFASPEEYCPQPPRRLKRRRR